MPAPCSEDNMSGAELSACSMASKVLLFLLVKQMSLSEGIMCCGVGWLRQLIISSNSLAMRFVVQMECCHPAPHVAICLYLGFLVPKEVVPPTHPILHQLKLTHRRPAGPNKQHGQGAPDEASEIPPAGTKENQQLKLVWHPNGSLPELPILIQLDVSMAAMMWHTSPVELHGVHALMRSCSVQPALGGKNICCSPR